jgi:hypothetical protein
MTMGDTSMGVKFIGYIGFNNSSEIYQFSQLIQQRQ